MAHYNNRLIIGLGGSIGSGKSVVREAFKVLNDWETIDSDKEAKSLYFDHKVRNELEAQLHIDPIVGEELDKGLLRSLLEEPDRKEILEHIIHRALFDLIKSRRASSTKDVLLVESAILFSSGLSVLCDKTIAVTAPEDVRRSRAEARDLEKGRDFFREMEKRQEQERKMLSDADYILHNYGHHSVILQTEQITKQILNYDRY